MNNSGSVDLILHQFRADLIFESFIVGVELE